MPTKNTRTRSRSSDEGEEKTTRKVKQTDREAIDDDTEVTVTIEVNGRKVLSTTMDRKGPDNSFNSGAVGFYLGGKVSIEALSHQMSMNLVQVGTKG